MVEEQIRQSILSKLSGYRYTHTLGCEKAAFTLAERYGADPDRAGLAALLHDITKRLSREEQLNLCEKYGIIPNDVEIMEWKMLHGKTAAAIAKAEYHVDAELADAIAYHTTGRASMTLMDKIVYLADYIEETRSFDGVEKARELAREDIDRALLYCFDSSIVELVARGKLIHPDTILARNDLLHKGNEK